MDTLIIHLDPSASKTKLKEALKLMKGISDVSEKLTISDVEQLADELLIREMKKADKSALLTFEDGKKEFDRLKKKFTK